jgi:hypothetical protein
MRSEVCIDIGLALGLDPAGLVQLGNEFGWVPDRVDLFLEGLGSWPSRLAGWPIFVWVASL